MDLLTALFDFKAMGIEVATGAMFVTLFLLLITGMPLAFVTLLVALIFALGWFGPMAVPLKIRAPSASNSNSVTRCPRLISSLSNTRSKVIVAAVSRSPAASPPPPPPPAALNATSMHPAAGAPGATLLVVVVL